MVTPNLAPVEPAVREQPAVRPPRDPSIDYLRAFVIILVMLAHCGLAYCYMVRQKTEWNSLAPIVDLSGASTLFDYLFNFADVCLMALMFFLSALFAWPALRRHGIAGFLRDRFIRLGLPFLGAIILLLPIAYYAAWGMANPGRGYGTFWLMLAHHRFGATGPAWFLWVLLLLDCILAGCFLLFQRTLARLVPSIERLQEASGRAALLLLGVCAIAYLPLFAHYGYGYGGWKIITLPFMLQPSRFLVYLAWCIAGFLVGSAGLEHGLIARSGALVRHWPRWTALCVVAFNALWLVPRLPFFAGLPVMGRHAALGLLWVFANVTCVLGLIAFFRGVVQRRRPVYDSLARTAYSMYLVHYIFVLWSQRLLLDVQIPILGKFAIAFTATLVLSWLTGLLVIRIPGVRRIV